MNDLINQITQNEHIFIWLFLGSIYLPLMLLGLIQYLVSKETWNKIADYVIWPLLSLIPLGILFVVYLVNTKTGW